MKVMESYIVGSSENGHKFLHDTSIQEHAAG